jgi:hypothetical protein
MGQPDVRSPEHRQELHELAGALVARGWERVGRGSSWYAERYRWPGDGAPGDLAAPPGRRADPDAR